MNLFRRLLGPDPALLALAQKVDELETRLHHQEVQTRNLTARLSAVEGDVAWITKPEEQPLPAPSDLPEAVVYHTHPAPGN